MTHYIEIQNETVNLHIHVQPKSSRESWGEVVEIQGKEWIQLRITAPPVDGAANKAIVKQIAKTLGAAKSNIKLIQGEKSRFKKFLIVGVKEQKLRAFLHKQSPVNKPK